MSDRVFLMDLERSQRIGFGEAILCDTKLPAHVNEILSSLYEPVLLTRLSQQAFDSLDLSLREKTDYDPVSRTAWYMKSDEGSASSARVAVVAAGTSDVPVAKEAVRTLGFNGIAADEIYDVGVAGLWRLLERVEEIRRYEIVIAVAGMDAALPTVLGGLVGSVIIAVPTSVGYGVATGGQTALNAILASCASGVTVVNIDNGYGAACAALRALSAVRSGAETKD